MLKKLGNIRMALVALLINAMLAVSASAQTGPDFSSIEVSIDPVNAVILSILGGLALLWGVRKIIKTLNKS